MTNKGKPRLLRLKEARRSGAERQGNRDEGMDNKRADKTKRDHQDILGAFKWLFGTYRSVYAVDACEEERCPKNCPQHVEPNELFVCARLKARDEPE